jgi:hypothetical protein
LHASLFLRFCIRCCLSLLIACTILYSHICQGILLPCTYFLFLWKEKVYTHEIPNRQTHSDWPEVRVSQNLISTLDHISTLQLSRHIHIVKAHTYPHVVKPFNVQALPPLGRPRYPYLATPFRSPFFSHHPTKGPPELSTSLCWRVATIYSRLNFPNCSTSRMVLVSQP